MIKREPPATINVSLTLTGQGETATFDAVINNVPKKQVMAEYQKALDADNIDEAMARVVMLIVKSWTLPFELNVDDLLLLDEGRPKILEGIVVNYHVAREVALTKN